MNIKKYTEALEDYFPAIRASSIELGCYRFAGQETLLSMALIAQIKR